MGGLCWGGFGLNDRRSDSQCGERLGVQTRDGRFGVGRSALGAQSVVALFGGLESSLTLGLAAILIDPCGRGALGLFTDLWRSGNSTRGCLR